MLKKVLIGLALALGVVNAKADIGVYDLMNDSMTIYTITLASSTSLGVATGVNQIFSAALAGGATSFPTLMPNRKVMELQNADPTSNVFCQIALSSTSANGDFALALPGGLTTSIGRKLAPNSSWQLGLPDRDNSGRAFMPWCVNDSAANTTKLVLTQGRNK